MRIALIAVAAPLDGSASTSLSLVSVTVNDESVEVAAAEGSATNTDPISADVSFTAAETDGATSLAVGQVTASASESNPTDTVANSTNPFEIPGTVTGSVTFEGVMAEVDAEDRYAHSALGHATLEANVMDLFVELTDVSIGSSQEVSTSSASASEDVAIGNLSLVPLREVLDRLSELSADDLIVLAEAVGGTYTEDDLATVEAARQEATDDINGIIGPLSLSLPPEDTSVQDLLDYADSCLSDPILSLLPGVCAAIAAAVVDLEDAVELLYEAVGELPLISLHALQAGVSSEAFDTTATASAGVTWESAQVAGIDLFEENDPEDAMTLLIEAVELVEAELQKIPGLEGLEIDVTRLIMDTSTTPIGPAQAASSSLNYLNVQLSITENALFPASLTVGINVLAMESAAQYEPPPPLEEEPPPVNNPPVAVDDSTSTPQNTAVTISVLPNDSDPDGDTITVVSFTQPSNGTANCTAEGVCTYTPNTGFSGTDTFTYTIADPTGATSTATVTITVPSPPVDPDPDPNNPPQAVDDSASTPHNTPVAVSVLPNDSDPDLGDTITVVSFTQPSNGTVTCELGTGVCTYTPNTGFSGTDTFTYTITDSSGATSTATVTITVAGPTTPDPDPDPDPDPEPANRPPEANNDAGTTPPGTPVDISVFENDSDPDGDTIRIVSHTNPSHGTVFCVETTGVCTYMPTGGFTGVDSFTYTISDPSGATSTATVTITVSDNPNPPPSNNPPEANNDSSTGEPDMPVTISVLPNDDDPDGDTLTVVDYTQPSNGTVTCTESGSCTYTPNPGFTGTDSFIYTIEDPSGASSSATVTITIPEPPDPDDPGDQTTTPTNGPPVAVNDSVTTRPGTPVDIPVLPNDSDPDGDFGLVDYTQPSNGSVVCNTSTGVCTYTPNPGFTGTDTFTYTISDPSGAISTATVTISIPDGPTTSGDVPGESTCSTGCGLARTGLDTRIGVLAFYMILGGFMVCRFSRKVA